MRYAKLKDGFPEYAPVPLILDGAAHYHPTMAFTIQNNENTKYIS